MCPDDGDALDDTLGEVEGDAVCSDKGKALGEALGEVEDDAVGPEEGETLGGVDGDAVVLSSLGQSDWFPYEKPFDRAFHASNGYPYRQPELHSLCQHVPV